MKFQSLNLPDGLIFHMSEPIEGRRNDLTIFRQSSIEEALDLNLNIDERQFYVYPDSAYAFQTPEVGIRNSIVYVD